MKIDQDDVKLKMAIIFVFVINIARSILFLFVNILNGNERVFWVYF